MTTRRWIIAGGGIAALLIAGLATWYVFLRTDAPPPVNLENAVAAVTSTTELPPTESTVAETTTTTTETTDAADTSVASEALTGTWAVAPGSDSFVGYRVQEELANVGATEAAGRTPGVVATVTATDTEVTSIQVEGDLTGLTSDEGRRDRALRTRGLETDSFPTARFVTTEPIALPATFAAGEPFETEVSGELTLHGVTLPVTAAVGAQLVGETVVVVGSMPITMTDYDIEPPTGFLVLSIDEDAIAEFQLVLERA